MIHSHYVEYKYLCLSSFGHRFLSSPRPVMRMPIRTQHLSYWRSHVNCYKLAIVRTRFTAELWQSADERSRIQVFLQSRIAWNLNWAQPKSASLESRQVFWSKTVSFPGLKKHLIEKSVSYKKKKKAHLQCLQFLQNGDRLHIKCNTDVLTYGNLTLPCIFPKPDLLWQEAFFTQSSGTNIWKTKQTRLSSVSYSATTL